MKRLFTILSTLSLLLFVAVVVMWVRSQRVVESVALTSSSGWSCAAWSSVTGFEVCGTNGLRAVKTAWAYHSRPLSPVPTVRRAGGMVYVEQSHLGRPAPRTALGGFGWTIDPTSAATDSRFGTYATSYWSFVVPYWRLDTCSGLFGSFVRVGRVSMSFLQVSKILRRDVSLPPSPGKTRMYS